MPQSSERQQSHMCTNCTVTAALTWHSASSTQPARPQQRPNSSESAVPEKHSSSTAQPRWHPSSARYIAQQQRRVQIARHQQCPNCSVEVAHISKVFSSSAQIARYQQPQIARYQLCPNCRAAQCPNITVPHPIALEKRSAPIARYQQCPNSTRNQNSAGNTLKYMYMRSAAQL